MAKTRQVQFAAPPWLRRLAVAVGALVLGAPLLLTFLMVVATLFPALMLTLPVLLFRGAGNPMRFGVPGPPREPEFAR